MTTTDLRRSLFEFEPGREGYYGEFGGSYEPEILHDTLSGLRDRFHHEARTDGFRREFTDILHTYSGRPTPVSPLPNLSARLGGARIFLKREDLNHTGAHKLNNVIGQGLLARRMGKTRVIAETGAGQHGVATATMASRLGLQGLVYMGEKDVRRQSPNVFWMLQLGAEVVTVKDGTRTLKDAMNAALRDWSDNMDTTHYVIGTACGPDPFPEMVAHFQSVIGDEAREQMVEAHGGLPDRVYACVGGGSNALGVFQAFLDDGAVELVGAEAGGDGIETGRHAARLVTDPKRLGSLTGTPGVAQGFRTRFLQDEHGQMKDTHSVAAGLDYIGVSPILANLQAMSADGKANVRFEAVSDREVVAAFHTLARTEGILSSLESAHAVALAIREAPRMRPDQGVLVNLSGRGDKDIFTVADAVNMSNGDPGLVEADRGVSEWRSFIVDKAVQYALDEMNAPGPGSSKLADRLRGLGKRDPGGKLTGGKQS